MTSPTANALQARLRTGLLRRAGGRTVAVLGFGALTWAAFTGSAMALDVVGQPAEQTSAQTAGGTAPETDATKSGIPLGDAVDSLTGDALQGLTTATDAVTAAPPERTAAERAAPEPAEVSTQDGPASAGSLDAASLVDSTVDQLTTYTVPLSSTAPPAGRSAPAAQPAPAEGPSGRLSILGLVGGAEGTANALSTSVLTATQLDQVLPPTEVTVLSSTLDSLGANDALPTVPLPQLPVVGEPVGDVLGTLPADLSGIAPVLPVPLDGQATPDPAPGMGAAAPVPPIPAVASQPSDPTIGLLPALPVLLPFETLPAVGSSGSPATFASLADGGGNGTGQDGVHLSRALLQTGGADAGEGSIPLPSSPHSPAGGHDGGSGSSHQQGGRLSSFTLPGGGLVSLVRDYRWDLPAAPTFDPGFSPD
jgi:hypothetical protein